jgi:hypothetical protein
MRKGSWWVGVERVKALGWRGAYFVSSLRKVIRSLRSLGFLRPPKAILVPGAYQSILLPGDALLLVGVGVREALDLAGLAAEEAV